ncbi:MAG TPA: hypothetical protein VJT73_11015 [Polyangiaceae bacterium]|nr:hypothetical protein [Polyangiaceae bacterium]
MRGPARFIANAISRSWFAFALAGCGAGGTPAPSDGQAIIGADGEGISDAGGEATPSGCSVPLPTTCPVPALHYSDVAPIFEQRCTMCHGRIVDGPWPLQDYEHVADWWDLIREDLRTCAMPPPDAGVAITLDERLTILTWIRCGFPK